LFKVSNGRPTWFRPLLRFRGLKFSFNPSKGLSWADKPVKGRLSTPPLDILYAGYEDKLMVVDHPKLSMAIGVQGVAKEGVARLSSLLANIEGSISLEAPALINLASSKPNPTELGIGLTRLRGSWPKVNPILIFKVGFWVRGLKVKYFFTLEKREG